MYSLICPDCLKELKAIDYDDQLCTLSGMLVGVEEHVCLQCGNSIFFLTNIRRPGEDEFVSRLETLEVTCFNERERKELPQEVLSKLIKNYYLELYVRLCRKIYKSSWAPAFEVILWEALENANLRAELTAQFKEFDDIIFIFKKMNIWVVNAASWHNIKKEGLVIVSAKKWKNMLKNKQTLLALDEPDKIGDP